MSQHPLDPTQRLHHPCINEGCAILLDESGYCCDLCERDAPTGQSSLYHTRSCLLRSQDLIRGARGIVMTKN
jgi:hypothetical protein